MYYKACYAEVCAGSVGPRAGGCSTAKRAPLSNEVAAKAGHFALGQVHGQGRSVLPGCRTLCRRGIGRRTAYVIVAAYAIIAIVTVLIYLLYSMWYNALPRGM